MKILQNVFLQMEDDLEIPLLSAEEEKKLEEVRDRDRRKKAAIKRYRILFKY